MIKPYYQEEGITIYHGDCRDILPQLEPVDLVLTDPPYGIGIIDGAKGVIGGANLVYPKEYSAIHGDDKPFDPSHLFSIADHMILFGGNYFASKLTDSRCWIVWDKNNGPKQADCEMVWTNFEKPSRIYRHTWNGIIREGEENISRQRKFHPHQKPVALLRFIIGYSDTEGLILDPYMGSGSTLVAAREMGRPVVGIEIEERYCEIAVKRLSQGVLFGSEDSLKEAI